MFYNFDQNNSGGEFVGPNNVIIEADNAKEANKIAKSVGIYFNGCDDGRDCPCCGDRWYPQDSDQDGTSTPLQHIDLNLFDTKIVIYYKSGRISTLKVKHKYPENYSCLLN